MRGVLGVPTLHHYVRFPPGGNVLDNHDDHDTIECDTAFDDDDDYDDDDDDGDHVSHLFTVLQTLAVAFNHCL